jgi:CTP:molybdopterin cytidylyltransferase MocA
VKGLKSNGRGNLAHVLRTKRRSARLEFPGGVDYAAAASGMRKHEQIIPIILAAGPSHGLPFPKALAVFAGGTALQVAVENCASVGPPLIVLGCDAGEIAHTVPAGARIAVNRRWRRGQLSSLQRALDVIPGDAAFLIYPVDHVLLKRETIVQLVRAFRTRRAPQEIVMPRYRRADGHPVLVSASVRKEFFGANTAREVIYRDPERIRGVAVRTSSIFEDFNTLESYEAFRRKFRAPRLIKAVV